MFGKTEEKEAGSICDRRASVSYVLLYYIL